MIIWDQQPLSNGQDEKDRKGANGQKKIKSL